MIDRIIGASNNLEFLPNLDSAQQRTIVSWTFVNTVDLFASKFQISSLWPIFVVLTRVHQNKSNRLLISGKLSHPTEYTNTGDETVHPITYYHCNKYSRLISRNLYNRMLTSKK